jgi:hypothetical protein
MRNAQWTNAEEEEVLVDAQLFIQYNISKKN